MNRAWLVVLIVLAPYVFSWAILPGYNFKLEAGWLSPFVAGVRQAFYSAVLSLIFGFILSLSLFSCSSRSQIQQVSVLLLAPNFVPALFVILSFMSFAQFFSFPHQGLVWVVLLHALINGGLFAIAFYTHYMVEVKSAVQVAKVLGASPYARFSKVMLPMSLPVLLQGFFLIFAICLMSFSIPFVLGGGRVSSLEVYIFRLVTSEGRWGEALLYSSLQGLMVMMVVALFWKMKWSAPQMRGSVYRSVISPHFRVLSAFPVILLFGFWLKDVVSALLFYPLDFFSKEVLILAAINSAFIFIGVFSVALLFGMFITRGPFSKALAHFFQGYIAPSVAVLGFSFIFLPGESEWALILKTVTCFTLLTFPLLFRWQVLEKWRNLEGQVVVAKSLGASSSQIFWGVVWPQLKEPLFLLSLVAAVWSLGDFAVSSFFLKAHPSLSLLVIDALNNYRLELSSWLGFLIFVFGSLIFYLGQRVLIRVGH